MHNTPHPWPFPSRDPRFRPPQLSFWIRGPGPDRVRIPAAAYGRMQELAQVHGGRVRGVEVCAEGASAQ